MRKLSLNLDNLAVETFEPSSAEAVYRGTVRGNNSADFTCTPSDCGTCVGCDTVEYTCNTGGPPTLPPNATCGNYTCYGMGETCVPMKTCIPPE